MYFFYDSSGYPAIRDFPKNDDILVDFLLTDIQSDIYFINEIEEIILSILKNETTEWQGNLNTYSIKIHKSNILITNEYNEKLYQFYDTDKFLQTIKKWKAFIENKNKDYN